MDVYRIAEEVNVALEVDREQRRLLQAALADVHSLRSSLFLQQSPAEPDNADSGPAGTAQPELRLPPADPRSARILQLTATVEDLTRRLQVAELAAAQASSASTGDLAISPTGTGTVYNKALAEKDSQIKQLRSLLDDERSLSSQLRSMLDENNRAYATEKASLQDQVSSLTAQLSRERAQGAELALETEVMLSHKDSLANSLRHERSLVNYAVLLLERNDIDAAPLKRMQHQFALDTMGASMDSGPHSTMVVCDPPAVGDGGGPTGGGGGGGGRANWSETLSTAPQLRKTCHP
eukprot:NODE_1223_length_1031_cov_7.423625_g849_i0.p1 GENE.NODE_1223_length_1031_cov_7.423625_g849_i0~~NODE_1223_length_1031_cov_7.423625_g849_i0.p1  ORF type:complete len:294 (+),score=57.47 NODE_1223_length_1031_cov_7.423625_g849_i0:55-936(+)